jgi:hypothetical protein
MTPTFLQNMARRLWQWMGINMLIFLAPPMAVSSVHQSDPWVEASALGVQPESGVLGGI